MRCVAGRLVVGLGLSLVLSACASVPQPCLSPAQTMATAEMFFGRKIGDRIGVSEAAFAQFTAREITPRWIDRREFAETQWLVENGNRFAKKLALEKSELQSGYHLLQWRLSCTSADAFRLDYQRQVDPANIVSTIALSVADAKPLYFRLPPFKAGGFELWTARVSTTFVQSAAALPTLEMSETSFSRSGQRQVHIERLSTDGLLTLMPDLLAFCRPAASRMEPVVNDIKAGDAAAGPAR